MATDFDISDLSEEFTASRKVLTALGDEVRQRLILTMIESGECNGMQPGDIAARMGLSRPAVSHHLGILMDAGILTVRKEGTKNYYRFDRKSLVYDSLIEMLKHVKEIMGEG